MKNFLLVSPFLALALVALVAGCAGPTSDEQELDTDGKTDTSVEATFLTFELDGELWTNTEWGTSYTIDNQLLYTVGQLNGDNSVGRLDQLDLTNVQTTEHEDGGYRVTYHARLLVAWAGSGTPETYTFRLPRNATSAGLIQFTESYSHDCVSWGAHDVTMGTMWYYYRPDSRRCEIADGDVLDITATVTESGVASSGQYPEYHKVWEDDVLRVVAIFTKYEDDTTTSSDAGISAYNEFTRLIRAELGDHQVVTVPEDIPREPGVDVPEVEYRATLADGRTVEVVGLLIDSIEGAGQSFETRYEELSARADLILYNGHSGLGANIRALAGMGRWVEGQYVIVFMNACDTYAYVDSALADAHAEVNPDDPTGTRHVDMVMNAMPSPFRAYASSSMVLIGGLLQYDRPRTFEQMLENMNSSQVIVVAGEEDNVYYPGYPGGGGGENPPLEPWEGMTEAGTVTQGEELRFQTPTLAAGRYEIRITGTGDADLYVRLGEQPEADVYDCRPYESSSNETCLVDVPGPAPIHIMIQGYAASSDFELVAGPEQI